MQLRYPASIQAVVDNTPTSVAELISQIDLELEQVADQEAITEFERTSAIWAQHQAPLNVAKVSSWSIPIKWNGRNLLDTARHTIQSGKFPPTEYPIPEHSIYFAQLALHVFVYCLSEFQQLHGATDTPNLLPHPSRWSTIFPAYPTLETYQDRLLKGPSDLLVKSYYLSEDNNPGITSLFTLPFLAILQERRNDPLFVLAVHMEVLSCARYTPMHIPRWVWDGKVSKEDMDEFLARSAVREWFDSQPVAVREECERLIGAEKFVAREERLRNVRLDRKLGLKLWARESYCVRAG
ncbi:hypothetical protein E1B28_001715 [Marasmius oreades]|uniref:Uncharacterized protein n=1 Tax=Marasmius oreades TaxID=181124 RepID=A0A9P7V442_9AGAR|nr:uncharacterized protein E1B28_001715 [Marasmius oreades]KAG7099918.1 hypothetical protein E1B28_001715 [Marasmius oreades]